MLPIKILATQERVRLRAVTVPLFASRFASKKRVLYSKTRVVDHKLNILRMIDCLYHSFNSSTSSECAKKRG